MKYVRMFFGGVGLILVLLLSLDVAGEGAGIPPLEQESAAGKVSIEVSGLGGSTGDTILIVVQRRVSEVVRTTVKPGTVFKSVSGHVQNMVAARVKGERIGETTYRPCEEIVLTDDAKHSYIVEAYCLEFHKDNPGPQDSFTVGSPDPRAARIVSEGQRIGASINAIQSALWIDREGLSDAQLKERFPVSDSDIAQARALLGQLEKNVRVNQSSSSSPVGGATAPVSASKGSLTSLPSYPAPNAQLMTGVTEEGKDATPVHVAIFRAPLNDHPGLPIQDSEIGTKILAFVVSESAQGALQLTRKAVHHLFTNSAGAQQWILTAVLPVRGETLGGFFDGKPVKTFEPGSITELNKLISVCGTPDHTESWDGPTLKSETYWWGLVGVAASEKHALTHLFLRGVTAPKDDE